MVPNNTLKRRLIPASAALAVGLAGIMTAAVAHANVIGVNFGGGNGGPYDMTAGQTTGVVAQTNWNNLEGATGSAATLNDSSGASTTATATWSGQDVWATYGSSSPNPSNPDLVLLNGYLDNLQGGANAVVTVSSVPYATYDVVAYFEDNNDGDTGSISLSGATTGNNTFYYRVEGTTLPATGNEFFQTTDTTDASNPPVSDYAIFTNVTGGSFTLTNAPGSYNTGLTGFQIVSAVPEPTSLVITGAGLAGLLLIGTRRRRSRA